MTNKAGSENIASELPKTLKQAIKFKGLTQGQLSQKIDVDIRKKIDKFLNSFLRHL